MFWSVGGFRFDFDFCIFQIFYPNFSAQALKDLLSNCDVYVKLHMAEVEMFANG